MTSYYIPRNPKEPTMNEATRAWIYRILLAIQPLVVAYGVATETEAVLWIGVASAVLGTGLATFNTSTSPDA
jgi:hypothetical protein